MGLRAEGVQLLYRRYFMPLGPGVISIETSHFEGYEIIGWVHNGQLIADTADDAQDWLRLWNGSDADRKLLVEEDTHPITAGNSVLAHDNEPWSFYDHRKEATYVVTYERDHDADDGSIKVTVETVV